MRRTISIDEPTREQRALAVLRRLLERGVWYQTAIEWDCGDMDGEELEAEVREIVDEEM